MTDDKRYGIRATVSKIHLDAGYLDHLRQQAAIELFKHISDGKHYTVKVAESITDAPMNWYNDMGSKTVDIIFEIYAVQYQHIVMPELPKYEAMGWFSLSSSAVDEIKRRIRQKVRGLFRHRTPV